jgi:dTDP-4-amino-4,6-dideoxygalactose transaminase
VSGEALEKTTNNTASVELRVETIRVPINKPFFGEEEAKAAYGLVIAGALTNSANEGGRKVREFEAGLAKYLHCKDVVAVNSGTSALVASLMAAGVKAGDEVIIPSFTFAATANAVKFVGGVPVFADIRESDYTVEVEDVRKKVSKKTKAVIPVNLYGGIADVAALREFLDRDSIPVIEDAAQSLGSTQGGAYSGTLGEMGCFSFYPSKVISTGEGGAVATNDAETAMKLRMIRNHGMVKGYDTTMLGLNFRLPEIEAALGVEQLRRLEGFITSRRRNAHALSKGLGSLGSVRIVKETPGQRFNWYLYTIYVRGSRDKLMKRLRERGFGATVYYDPPVHRTPYYASIASSRLPKTDDAAAHVLSIPVHPFVTESDIDEMVTLIKTDEKPGSE